MVTKVVAGRKGILIGGQLWVLYNVAHLGLSFLRLKGHLISLGPSFSIFKKKCLYCFSLWSLKYFIDERKSRGTLRDLKTNNSIVKVSYC